MKIEEDKNTIIKEFDELYNLYGRLKIETNRLEGSNGYIQKLFQEWNKTSIERMLRGKNDENIVLSQEKTEMERLENGDKNSLRFFKPYYDDFSVQISKGEIPDFLKSKQIELDIEMPIRKKDTEGFEKAKKQYINMPMEKRTHEKEKIIKGLALIYARQANIFNRFKTSEKVEFENAMKSKLNSIRNFLQYATLYNSMVSKEEQIAFGINDSEKGPILEASLPGYTRLSVHFGNAKNCKETLEKTNEFLEGQNVKSYFPTFKDGKINLNAVYERRGYDLPKFDVINTGIITRTEYEDLRIYEQQIRGKNTNAKVNSKRVEMFVNLMYPDLNDREIFYLAEKSEFGKKHLEDLKVILEERNEKEKIADKSKKDIRSVYIEQEMENILNLKFNQGMLNDLTFGDIYLYAMKELYGDFTESIEKSKDILNITGRVLPVTLDEIKICAELEDGTVVEQRDKIPQIAFNKVTKINRIYINPSNCMPAPGVLEAIKNADAIVIGPGSLYTNVIPNLLVKNISKTIKESKAIKIYVNNIMTEPGQTDNYSISDHIQAIIDHAGGGIIDYCIYDTGEIVPEFIRRYNMEGQDLVEQDIGKCKDKGVKLLQRNLSTIIDDNIRHSPKAVAEAIIQIICDDLKFKDRQNDAEYIMLNARLKEEKRKKKNAKPIFKTKQKTKTNTKEKQHRERKTSKFNEKYKDRIESIKTSDEKRIENIKKMQEENKE